MKWIESFPVLILILGGSVVVAAQFQILEGSMVFIYGVDLNEHWDSSDPRNVTIELTIGINGVNEDSPYYNCGVTERMAAISLEVPEQDLVMRNQVQWETGGSNLSYENSPTNPEWYYYALAWLMSFSLIVDPGDTEVELVFGVEIDTIDIAKNDSEVVTVTESVSFNYLIHHNDTLILILGISVGFITVAAIVIILKRRE